MQNYKNEYVTEARQLRAKGRQLAGLFQMYKTLGFANFVFGLIGLYAAPLSAIPVGVGVVTYIMSLAIESNRLGRINLIPFVTEDLNGIAHKSLTTGTPEGALEVQPHHYLDSEDKALYYLCNYHGDQLAELSRSVEDEATFEHVVINLVDQLVAIHGRDLNYPELLSHQRGEGRFFKDAIEALPAEMGLAIPVKESPARPKFAPLATPTALPYSPETRQHERGFTGLYDTVPATAAPIVAPRERAVATQSITALVRLMQAPMANRAFIGAQRTGKSGLVAVAGRELAKDGVTFYHINLASYSDGHSEDDDYTKHIHPSNSVRGDIAIAKSKEEVHRLVDKAASLVHDWFRTKNSILIVDEWFSLASQTIDYSDVTYPLAQLIAGKLAHLTSAGTKRGLALWLITPQVKAGAMTEAGKEIKQCKLCYVGISPHKSIDWNGNRITWDAELYQYVSKNFPIDYPSGNAIQGESRIAYVNGEWLPLGTTSKHFEEMARTARATPQPKPEMYGADIDVKSKSTADVFAIAQLPKGVPEDYAERFLMIVITWLEERKDKLPVAKADLTHKGSALMRKNITKLGKDRWNMVLEYWADRDLITLDSSSGRGTTVSLPVDDHGDGEMSLDDLNC